MKIPQVKDIKLNYAVKKTACKPASDRSYGMYRTIKDDIKRKSRKLSAKDKQKLEIEYYLSSKEKGSGKDIPKQNSSGLLNVQ